MLFLASLFRGLPASFKVAGVAVLLMGALEVKHWWTVRGLRKQVAAQMQTIKDERAANAELRSAVSDQNVTITTLTARLKEQSSAILIWQAKAKASDANAAKKAVDAVRAGENAAEAIRSGHTHLEPGHAAVNQALCERFQSCAP